MELDFRVAVLLSSQRALWDVVTANLRGVAIEIKDAHVSARFLFENIPADEDLENVSLAGASMCADFDDAVIIEERADYVPIELSRDLRPGEEWIYLRKE